MVSYQAAGEGKKRRADSRDKVFLGGNEQAAPADRWVTQGGFTCTSTPGANSTAE